MDLHLRRFTGSRSSARRPSPGRAFGAIAALTLLLAACGSPTASNGVARLGSPDAGGSGASAAPSASSDPYQQMLAYAACMRSHGLADFPDPVPAGNGQGGGFQIQGGPGSDLDPNSATMKAAMDACKSLMPTPPAGAGPGGSDSQGLQQALAYSKCMRDHGLTDFPDPQVSSDGGGISLKAPAGLDLNSPTFQAAQQACQSLMPGGAGGGATSTGGPIPSTQP